MQNNMILPEKKRFYVNNLYICKKSTIFAAGFDLNNYSTYESIINDS